MRKIYNCIDIGSHSIKMVVMEKINNKFVVLSKAIVKSKGIRNSFVENEDDALISIKKAINKVEEDLNLKIENILFLVPSNQSKFMMRESSITIDDGVVNKNDITRLFQKTIENVVTDEEILVDVVPVFYRLDDGENTKEVLGLNGNLLLMKAVLSTIPKKNIRTILNIFKRLGINVIDIGFKCKGDYFATLDNSLNNAICGVINIGYDTTEVSVFNKGILIKTDVIEIGSRIIDRNISSKYNLEIKKSRYLKENFAVSNTRYSDAYETIDMVDKNQNMININQLQISELIEKNLYDILKIAKKQINVLTNKEISYIIVTGGISEMAGFQYVLDNVFGKMANVLSMNNMGIRLNSYSSCAGFIYAFSKKLEERGKTYTMISEEQLNIDARRKKATSDSGLGGIINYFTGNKED